MTDIPCMTLVKQNGGRSIAVYPEKESDKVKDIYTEGRCNYICRADYTSGSDLDKLIRLIIDVTAIGEQIDKKEEAFAKK